MSKRGPKIKSDHKRETVLAEVSKWAVRGFSQRAIATKLEETMGVKVTQPQIGVYLKQVNERYKAEAIEDRRIMVMRKLEELREVRNEAWVAWEKSKEDVEKRVKETGETEKGGFSKDRLEVIGRLPGGEYLQVVLNCIKAERELLGLDEAMKVNMSVVTTAIPWDELVGHRNEIDLVEAEIQKVEQLAITQGEGVK